MDREHLDSFIIKGISKGLKTSALAKDLQAKKVERPSGGKIISRKDINNIILRLRRNGKLPQLKKSKGNSMRKLTVEQVVKSTGMSQKAIADKVNVAPGTLVNWKKKGAISEAYVPKFLKLMGKNKDIADNEEETQVETQVETQEITKTMPKKRRKGRRPNNTIMQEVTPEEIGVSKRNNNTIFIVTNDINVINDLISRFI